MLVHNKINMCNTFLFTMSSFDGLALSWKSLLPQGTEHTKKHLSCLQTVLKNLHLV